MTLPYLKEFLNNLVNQKYSEKTIYNYDRDLKIFEKYLSNNLKKEFILLDKNDITIFSNFLISSDSQSLKKNNKQTLSKSSINRLLSALKSYIQFLEINDHKIPFSPNSIKLHKIDRKYAKSTSYENIIKLVESPLTLEKNKVVGIRNNTMLSLILNTGLTISELINLNILNFDPKENSIEIVKNDKKQRHIILNLDISKKLKQYLNLRKDKSKALFIPYRGANASSLNSRISPNYLQMKIKQYREDLGLDIIISAHTLRQVFVNFIIGTNVSSIKPIDKIYHHQEITINQYISN